MHEEPRVPQPPAQNPFAMSSVNPFPNHPVTVRPIDPYPSHESGGEPIKTARPFREIKSFATPIEGKIFIVSSNDEVAQVHQSRDAGQTWQLALVMSMEEYHRGMNAFWIDDPDCQDSESFLEMVRFIQSGYVLPNGFPVRNFWDPAEQWTEIQCAGAVFGIFRERVR